MPHNTPSWFDSLSFSVIVRKVESFRGCFLGGWLNRRLLHLHNLNCTGFRCCAVNSWGTETNIQLGKKSVKKLNFPLAVVWIVLFFSALDIIKLFMFMFGFTMLFSHSMFILYMLTFTAPTSFYPFAILISG